MNTPTGRNRLRLLVLMTTLQAAFAGAQAIDIAGEWEQPSGMGFIFSEDNQDRGLGPDQGDYAGLPINAAARFKAQHYHPDWLTVPEHQCIPHPVTYQERSPTSLSVIKDYNLVTQRVTAYRTSGNYGLMRTIWMDGRAHPSPIARHTFEGFSTGQWLGDKLAVETTHIKAGWLRRNGVPTSDQARIVEYYVRHGDYMTVTLAVDDPLYLEEPFVRSTDYHFNQRGSATQMSEFGGFVNGGTGATFYKCAPIDEVEREAGVIPSILPGKNRDLVEMFINKYQVPGEAAFGGAYTAYPEFQRRLRTRDFANLQPPPVQTTPRQANRRAPAASPTPPAAAPADAVLSQHVAGKVWMISVGGQNTVVQIGDEGVLVVDPGSAEQAQAVLGEIRRLAGNQPIRVVLNTSADLNRIAATPIVAGATPGAQRATVIGHENIGLQWAREKNQLVPNDMLYKSVRNMYFNGEFVQIIPVPAAHSNSDVIVHFRQSDVIATGNVLRPDSYPLIDKGGSLQGTIDALNRILSMTVAEWRAQGGTMVVPGTSRLYDQGDVAEYRDMVTIVRDRLQSGLDDGLTAEQVKAAGYTRDYDGRYGSRPGAGSTTPFVEVALQNLTRRSTPSR